RQHLVKTFFIGTAQTCPARRAARGAPGGSAPPTLALVNVSKSFGAVRALQGVTLELHAGEVHALAGENGAGQSTGVKTLGGVHRPDAGEARVHGEAVTIGR